MASTSLPQPTHTPTERWIGSTLIVQSSTNPRQFYTVTATGCTCPAAKFRPGPCKHQTRRADVLAVRPTRQPMSDKQYADVLEACDDLY